MDTDINIDDIPLPEGIDRSKCTPANMAKAVWNTAAAGCAMLRSHKERLKMVDTAIQELQAMRSVLQRKVNSENV